MPPRLHPRPPRTWFAIGLAVAFSAPARAGVDDPIQFNRDIRPILSENCNSCHGPDRSHRKAGLRLDDRAVSVEKAAIVPGKPSESALIERIESDDPEEVMPPPSSAKVLTADQKALLKRWIDQGAPYQAHWAYEPIAKPAIPKASDPGTIENPVDNFILANLDAKGIKPSPMADRRTLIRRLSLDLIGLPPTPDEVGSFLVDTDANAYEKLVDRLLASPHFGERMAVAWLDLARFADTVGYHGDQNQDNFPYRDYVISAFNANMPFDRFTAEQIAGDLLPDPTPDQLVASGFNRLNMMTREGGAQPKEYLAKYAGDRVRTVAITWLGSTLGCAECHDHKFDPFTAKDFYKLSAFFADVEQWGVYADYAYTPNPDLRGVGNDHPFPPEIEVASPYLQRRIERTDLRIGEVLGKVGVPTDDPAFRGWKRSMTDVLDIRPDGWISPAPSIVGGGHADEALRVDAEGSLVLGDGLKPKEEVKVRLAVEPGWLAAIRVEVLPDPARSGSILRGKATSAQIQVSATVRSGPEQPGKPVAFWFADAAAKQDRYANGSAILGILDLWKTSANLPTTSQVGVWLVDRPVRIEEGGSVEVSIRADNAARVRVSTSPVGFTDARSAVASPALALALATDPAAWSEADRSMVRDAYLFGTGHDGKALADIRALARERIEYREGRARSMITKSRPPTPVRVLSRGNWQDETGEIVAPGVPGFLPQPSASPGERLDRLDLARWITSADNPLTARVFVNRLWRQFFGNGLSVVMEDVGAQGESPSHPELLDWLADQFRSDWDIKKSVKSIVMSGTYRRSSSLRPELRDLDPNNRWLASQNPRRLEAEFVRDNALAVSGLLDREVGGPSAFPYQPSGYYANLQFPNRDYPASRDDRQYRRGVYSHWQRTFLHPMLANFDAPSREECTASRNLANTPQQALTLLNDPTFVEAARALASGLPAGPDAGRIDQIYRQALGREVKPAERVSLIAFLEKVRIDARDRPIEAEKLVEVGLKPRPIGGDPVELAAWTEVCRVILNLHETITRY